MGRRGLPDRWLNYSPVGERIAGTSFIAFKVPLKETMVRSLPQHERFTTQVLMESVPNIGIVIDLTNTDRYYDCKDFLGKGVRYEKIFCRGHEIPSRSVVDKFFSAVDKFVDYLQSSSADHDGEKLIGVHCTHGLNRTGYLVCRYMIRRLGFSPEDAISAFEKARGYPMEREEYLENLRKDENCTALAGSDVNPKRRAEDGFRSYQNSSSHVAEVNSVPTFRQRPWTDSAPSNSWGMQTGGFVNFSRSSRANNFERFPADMENGSFGVSSECRRANGLSWPPKNNRADDFNNFTESSRSARTSSNPDHWESAASFNPEERVSHKSRDVSRRFYDQGYEENSVTEQRQYDHQPRSASFSQDFRQASPWRRHHTETEDRHYLNY